VTKMFNLPCVEHLLHSKLNVEYFKCSKLSLVVSRFFQISHHCVWQAHKWHRRHVWLKLYAVRCAEFFKSCVRSLFICCYVVLLW